MFWMASLRFSFFWPALVDRSGVERGLDVRCEYFSIIATLVRQFLGDLVDVGARAQAPKSSNAAATIDARLPIRPKPLFEIVPARKCVVTLRSSESTCLGRSAVLPASLFSGMPSSSFIKLLVSAF